MQTVAVLGLGKMGHAIAFRLLNTGHKVVVWNRHSGKAKDLMEKGAVLAESPAAAARVATIVISMLADDTASSAVWLGSAGALNSMQPGSVVIECSTVSSGQLKKIATLAGERNLRFIDCPVTGLPEVASEGKLTLLVGADPSDLEQVRTVLEKISTTIRYFGPVGSGNAYKLLINLMGAVQIAALAEGVALANDLGLDKEAVINAIETSAAASPQVVRHVRKMVERRFDENPSFTTTLRYKDARYALDLAAANGSEMLLGTVAAKWFEEAGFISPGKDEAAVVLAIDSSRKKSENGKRQISRADIKKGPPQ